MNRFFCIAVLALLLPALSWAGGSKDSSTSTKQETMEETSSSGISLMEAIDLSAERIAEDVSNLADRIAQAAGKRRIAVVAFESESDALSDFIMSELSGALFDRNIEIVERQGLNWVIQELNFQMSGAVSDDTIQALGQFMGAELIVTGQLRHLGGNYRLTANAIRVEQATRASIPRFDVRDDRAMRDMVAAINNRTLKVRSAEYSVTVETKPQTAGAFLDRGIQFAMRSDFDAARADFTEALRLDPNLVGAYMLRGRTYVASALYVVEVGTQFSSVRAVDIFILPVEERRALLDLAIADFTNAIRLDPRSFLAYTERGSARTFTARDHPSDYIKDFNEAIRLNPNYAPAYTLRAWSKRQDPSRPIAERHAAALEDYNQAIRLDPNNKNAYNGRGTLYVGMRDYDRAIADFTTILRLDPNDFMAYDNRGVAYGYKRDFDRAIADHTAAIRLDPNYVNAYYNRGNAHRAKGDLDRAIADWEAVLRLDPNDADARRNLEQDRRARGR